MSAIQPTALEPVLVGSLKSGLITQGAIAEDNYPIDAVIESINYNFDVIGEMTLRPGSTQLGESLAASPILGLYNFLDSGAGTNNRLIAVNGTVAYYLSGSTWTSKRAALTPGSKARFSTLLDFVFMVNGTDPTAVWDGNPANSFDVTGNALNAPIGKFIENFRARMWIAGNPTYPDRVYYSTLPAAISTPVITWDTNVTTGQWIDVSPSDGENITALHRTKSALLVFKNNHLYRIYSILQADPDANFNVGTYSQESVVETKNGVYFHHPTGFFRYDGGVTEISRPIIDIVKAITLENYYKIASWVETDGDHICWSVGDVTVRGIQYRNLVVRYTISTQVWTHYSYPTQFLVANTYNNGSNLVIVAGNATGKVVTMNSGTTDDGTEIIYSIMHPFLQLDGLTSTEKIINTMFVMHRGMTGANVNYQIPGDKESDFTKKIGQIKSEDTGFNNLNARGRKIRFRVTGSSKGQPITYEGLEVLQGTTQLIGFGN